MTTKEFISCADGIMHEVSDEIVAYVFIEPAVIHKDLAVDYQATILFRYLPKNSNAIIRVTYVTDLKCNILVADEILRLLKNKKKCEKIIREKMTPSAEK